MHDASDIVSEDIDSIIYDIKEFAQVFRNKRVLVVGGKGFLGTYFVRTLIALNQFLDNSLEIVVMDNLITAKDKTNFQNTNVQFIEKDISEKIT